MSRYVLCGSILWLSLVPVAVTPAETVTLDGHGQGRTFEGLGGLSAGGGTSRLLIEYPEPQRSQVLDFLFKPNFGASLHHLKVEIGSDVNSTEGTEPSYARTRAEFENPRPEYFDRGYQWWIMREAKKRNPGIYLDVLQWGAPDWIGDKQFPDVGDPNKLEWKDRVVRNRKKFYTQDNADFVVGFIKGAKKYHGLDIDFCGIWNEVKYDAPWIKLLRKTLDCDGLSRVAIVAADDVCTWSIVDAFSQDADLKKAIRVVGVHYPGGIAATGSPTSTAAAKECGKPLWSSEDGPWRDDWAGACALAKLCNRNYIHAKIVKTVIWNLLTAYYDNLPLPNAGLMRANTPWSGHYELRPCIWAVAHTTQFTKPGWKYLDSACRLLKDGGSYVALRSLKPRGDYSIIAETIDAKIPQTVSFRVTGGLATGPVHVWRSNQQEQFVRCDDISLVNDSFLVVLEPGCIYSLTTTTGQQKGKTAIPPAANFPLPYKDDCESSQPGRMPRHFADQGGAFEVASRADGGKCMRQMIVRRGIDWGNYCTPKPFTMIGSTTWQNYAVRCNAYVERSGSASLFGRILKWEEKTDLPKGYQLKVSTDGLWELNAFTKTLAAGTVPFAADRWHRLTLQFNGPKVIAGIDGVEVKVVEDRTFGVGMAGVGSGWNYARFDNFAISALH